jgi:hypothetical protein
MAWFRVRLLGKSMNYFVNVLSKTLLIRLFL